MRPFVGEMEIGIARQPFRGVEIGRAIDHVRTVGIPDAADVGERLEAIERYAALGEGLGHRETRGARADDSVTLHPPSMPAVAKRPDPYAILRARPKHQTPAWFNP